MSDAEGRRFARVYFTRAAARRELAELSPESANDPPEVDQEAPTPDPFEYDGAVAQPDPTPLTLQQLERHRQFFLPVAESAAAAAQRRLQFSPLVPLTVLPNPQRMAIAPNRITNLKVKFQTFTGSKKEDPDCHVSQFETKWLAGGYDLVYGDPEKLQQFQATLEGKAIEWFSGYPLNAFATYDALKTGFLGRFRKEKTPNELLRKIRNMK